MGSDGGKEVCLYLSSGRGTGQVRAWETKRDRVTENGGFSRTGEEREPGVMQPGRRAFISPFR